MSSAHEEESRPQPSCSRYTRASSPQIDEDEFELNIIDENAEIARLEEGNITHTSTEIIENDDDERVAKINFNCAGCDMQEMVHYFGKEPPFAAAIEFLEDTYVMRDPFQPPPPRWKQKPEFYIAIGVNCANCEKSICKDNSCSFHYTRTLCLDCAQADLKNFPLEAQAKLRKLLADK